LCDRCPISDQIEFEEFVSSLDDHTFRSAQPERERVVAMCPFLREASELDEKEWREFLSLFNTVLATAQSGQDWPKVLHKQVHDAGNVTIQRSLGKWPKI
jgi:hypothetical protein